MQPPWGIPTDNNTFSNNRSDKKDQLLEINPMALRLSGQSFAWGFDEHSHTTLSGVHGQKAGGSLPEGKTLEHPDNPNLSSLHNFIQNTQPPDQSPTSRKLVSLNDVFAFRPSPKIQKTLVEADGIEPTTPCLQSRCSPS